MDDNFNEMSEEDKLMLKNYLLQKNAAETPTAPANLLDNNTYNAELTKAKTENESRNSGNGWLQFAASIGDAMAGRDSSKTAANFNQIRDNNKQATIGALEANRTSQQRNLDANMTQQKLQSEKNKQDWNSQESISFRRMMESQFPNVVKSYGDDWQHVTAGDQDNIFKPLQLRENMDMRRDQARLLSNQRADVLKAKATEKQDKKMQSMNEIEDRRQNINANVAQLKSMIDESGTWEMLGSHNQDMDRLVEQVAIDMAKLMDPNSVARPSEVESVKKTLIKPGFQNSNSTALDVLKNFEGEINRRADSAYKIRGLQSPNTGDRPQSVENGVAPKPKNGKIKVSNGKETLLIDATDLTHALQDGFKEVN